MKLNYNKQSARKGSACARKKSQYIFNYFKIWTGSGFKNCVLVTMPTDKHVKESNLSSAIKRKAWNVEATSFAQNTINPIRRIVEKLKIEPNPEKYMIPLSIGKLVQLRKKNLKSSSLGVFCFFFFLIKIYNCGNKKRW